MQVASWETWRGVQAYHSYRATLLMWQRMKALCKSIHHYRFVPLSNVSPRVTDYFLPWEVVLRPFTSKSSVSGASRSQRQSESWDLLRHVAVHSRGGYPEVHSGIVSFRGFKDWIEAKCQILNCVSMNRDLLCRNRDVYRQYRDTRPKAKRSSL